MKIGSKEYQDRFKRIRNIEKNCAYLFRLERMKFHKANPAIVFGLHDTNEYEAFIAYLSLLLAERKIDAMRGIK